MWIVWELPGSWRLERQRETVCSICMYTYERSMTIFLKCHVSFKGLPMRSFTAKWQLKWLDLQISRPSNIPPGKDRWRSALPLVLVYHGPYYSSPVGSCVAPATFTTVWQLSSPFQALPRQRSSTLVETSLKPSSPANRGLCKHASKFNQVFSCFLCFAYHFRSISCDFPVTSQWLQARKTFKIATVHQITLLAPFKSMIFMGKQKYISLVQDYTKITSNDKAF